MSDANLRQKAEDRYYAALDLMADGKLEEAVAAYRASLEIDPTFTEAMHGLARALQDLQRYDEGNRGCAEDCGTGSRRRTRSHEFVGALPEKRHDSGS